MHINTKKSCVVSAMEKGMGQFLQTQPDNELQDVISKSLRCVSIVSLVFANNAHIISIYFDFFQK